MKTKMQNVRLLISVATFFAVAILPVSSFASNSWGSYHWARRSNPFTLKVVDSNTAAWDDNLNQALADWSTSTVLNLTREAGDSSTSARQRCVMIAGKIHSCNYTYGSNGWLGLASINISGSHITQATSKMNDTYFNSSSYSETNRQHVMCQEIGHDFGLEHQSTSGADLNTCMDYANALDNPRPNSHDYNQLQTIYSHLDSTTTIGFSSFGGFSAREVTDDPGSWGRLIRQTPNGRGSTYERHHADGTKTVTNVFWTKESAEKCRGCDHRYQ